MCVSLSIPDTDPPELLYSPLFFFGFRSPTLSVSFYIMLSVKVPCGRANSSQTHQHTPTVPARTLTLTCTRVHLLKLCISLQVSQRPVMGIKGSFSHLLSLPLTQTPAHTRTFTHTKALSRARTPPNALFSATMW